MKLIALFSLGFASALASASVAPNPTPTPTLPISALAHSDCTTSTVKMQQFNNKNTSTIYLTTRTKTHEFDCHGCSHITTSWIGSHPEWQYHPTTVTVKKTTTTVALCSASPTGKASSVFGDAGVNTAENKAQDAGTADVLIPEKQTLDVETPEVEAEELDFPEGVEIVDF